VKQFPIITLTTDFGYRDPLTGIMKGIILGLNPGVRIVDITHGIQKYDVREAALIIGMGFRDFPLGSIHVVITDPGVGSSRRPILVAAEDHYFVGPDNGLFSVIYHETERLRVFHITAEHYLRRERSTTFHGRDIFAPVAAWLSRGIDPANFGEEITDYVKLRFPSPSMPTGSTLEGEVIYIDTFGNAMTNIRRKDIDALRSLKPAGKMRIVSKGKEIAFKEYYSQAEDKELYALINSMDYLELFVFRGDSSRDFGMRIGDTIGIMLM
jgi:S-adenosylmethionine hydrolase